MSEDNVTRWVAWQKKDTVEQWGWLEELGLFPRRRPVLGITEELAEPKTEEIENDIPERVDGAEERFE